MEPGKPVFTVANLSELWVIASVPESQIAWLAPGATAEVRAAALGDRALRGKVSFIDPNLNEETRSARVRISVANPNEVLKAGMFCEVTLTPSAPAGRLQLMVAESAFQRKAEPAFKPFWDRLGKAATEAPSIWTTQGEWRLAKETALPPEAMTNVDQAAIADLGLALIHPELRRHWTVLSSIGAQQLRLSNLVSALEALGDDAMAGGGEPLRRLWSAIELLIDVSSDRTGLPTVLAKLKAVPFMLDVDDHPISPMEARRLQKRGDYRRAKLAARQAISLLER